MAAAGAGLSCAGAGNGQSGGGGPSRLVSHIVEVHSRGPGQYAVVESKSPGNIGSFRGKLEAEWGDDLVIHNMSGDQIRLYFPEPDIFETPPKPEVLVENGKKFGAAFAKREVDGRYEYGVLYKKRVLNNKAANVDDASIWGFAIGGSSAEFIIRRRR
jgi:hypothetical protein